MNKADILEQLDRFPYDRREYWVLTGAAMVLYGIRSQTADIDLGCTSQMADQLEAGGYLYQRTSDGKRWFRYGPSLEIFEDWIADSTVITDDFQLISLPGLLKIKQELGREKDLKDIALIRQFMDNQPIN